MGQRAGKDRVQSVRTSQREEGAVREEGGERREEGGGRRQWGGGRRKRILKGRAGIERAEPESARSQKWNEEQLSLHGDRALA